MEGFKRRVRRQRLGLVLVGARKSREREGVEGEMMKGEERKKELLKRPWT